MKTNCTFALWTATALACATLLGVAGCNNDGLAQRYPVSGQVTYRGKPVEKGSITFVPEKAEGRGAVGEIKNGAYSLTTQTPGDGAFPGPYSVTVADLDVDMDSANAESAKEAERLHVEKPSMPDQAAVGRAVQRAKSNVPERYGQIATSNLKAEVKAGSNTFNFELTD